MDAAWWVLIGILGLVVIAAIVWAAVRDRRTRALRTQFGPEYDRMLEHENRRDVENELAVRRRRRERLDIRPLTPDARRRYAMQWEELQKRFVDAPAGALTDADWLVMVVMRERGYPMDDFDQRAADVSVDHPQVVENYRVAHRIASRASTPGATTEDMRRGLVHYRALFADLLMDGGESEMAEAR
jgi:hypothetical protein